MKLSEKIRILENRLKKIEDVLDAKHLNHELDEEEEDKKNVRRAFYVAAKTFYVRPGTKASKGFKPKKKTMWILRGVLGGGSADVEWVWHEGNVRGCARYRTFEEAVEQASMWLSDPPRIGCPGTEFDGPFVAEIEYDKLGNIISYANLEW